jgi:hypothetical protein
MRRRRPTAAEKARRKDERMREVFKLANVTRWGEVRAAVLAGFDVNTSAPCAPGFLLVAAATGMRSSEGAVTMLLQLGANPNCCPGALWWPAHNPAILRALVDAGGNVNDRCGKGHTLLTKLAMDHSCARAAMGVRHLLLHEPAFTCALVR